MSGKQRTSRIRLVALILIYSGMVASGFGAETITVSDRPKFETRGGWTDIVLTNSKEEFEIYWGTAPTNYFMPVTLDTNRVYTFTIAEVKHLSVEVPEIRRIELEGKTIYDAEVCEIHKIKMDYGKVKIIYGLVRPTTAAPSFDTERQLFPHHREYTLGGCSVGPEKTTRIFVCGECKKAYDKWMAKHKPD